MKSKLKYVVLFTFLFGGVGLNTVYAEWVSVQYNSGNNFGGGGICNNVEITAVDNLI